MSHIIYIIDDDPDMIRVAGDLLKDNNYVVKSSLDPVEGLKKINENTPDLLLLDLQMPQMDGFEVCKKLKSQPKTSSLPIIIVSIQGSEADVVTGLELGASDYIQKPFRPRELLARVKSTLRKNTPIASNQVLKAGPLHLDMTTYSAKVEETKLDLPPKEFELLALFVHREGQVLTRSTISQLVWKTDHLPTSRTINTHVVRLRKKLGRFRNLLQSLPGVGYRFEVDEA